MTRIDYDNDRNAPRGNSLVSAPFAIVTEQDGRILLYRRRDNRL